MGYGGACACVFLRLVVRCVLAEKCDAAAQESNASEARETECVFLCTSGRNLSFNASSNGLKF